MSPVPQNMTEEEYILVSAIANQINQDKWNIQQAEYLHDWLEDYIDRWKEYING